MTTRPGREKPSYAAVCVCVCVCIIINPVIFESLAFSYFIG